MEKAARYVAVAAFLRRDHRRIILEIDGPNRVPGQENRSAASYCFNGVCICFINRTTLKLSRQIAVKKQKNLCPLAYALHTIHDRIFKRLAYIDILQNVGTSVALNSPRRLWQARDLSGALAKMSENNSWLARSTSVRLIVCCAGKGGENSFAQELVEGVTQRELRMAFKYTSDGFDETIRDQERKSYITFRKSLQGAALQIAPNLPM